MVRYYSYCGHGTGTPGDDDPSEMDGYNFTYDARRELTGPSSRADLLALHEEVVLSDDARTFFSQAPSVENRGLSPLMFPSETSSM